MQVCNNAYTYLHCLFINADFAHRYEKLLSRFAYASLCVSQAMKKDMQDRMNARLIAIINTTLQNFYFTSYNVFCLFFSSVQ